MLKTSLANKLKSRFWLECNGKNLFGIFLYAMYLGKQSDLYCALICHI